jgi:hypothetical protein
MAGQTLRVVEQRFQQMLGKKILMAPCQGFHLRGLQQGAGAFGQIREVNFWHSDANSRPRRAREAPDLRSAQCATAGAGA